MGTQLPHVRGTMHPLFGPCLFWPNGRPSQLLSSCCRAHDHHRPTDHATRCVRIVRIYVRSTAMRPNMNVDKQLFVVVCCGNDAVHCCDLQWKTRVNTRHKPGTFQLMFHLGKYHRGIYPRGFDINTHYVPAKFERK